MVEGVRRALPDADVDCCPIGDGGEGTLEALLQAVAGTVHEVPVTDALGIARSARFASFHDGMTAYVEAAEAIGLELVPEPERDPTRTTSFGVGELILAACDTGVRSIVVGIGGSATNDGGCGMAQALGYRFFDSEGREMSEPLTGGRLPQIARICPDGRKALSAPITIACDVDNPLTGPRGAAHVYGPQKGATDEQAAELDSGLGHFADVVLRDLGVDVATAAGAGAAGGLGAGLLAFAAAGMRSGIGTVLNMVQFDRRVRGCDLCLTGEGRLDGQSLSGKACLGVAQAAARYNVPCIALVGSRGPDAEKCLGLGLEDIVVIGEGMSEAESMRRAAELIADTAERVIEKYQID